jgi:hypothetical protein
MTGERWIGKAMEGSGRGLIVDHSAVYNVQVKNA